MNRGTRCLIAVLGTAAMAQAAPEGTKFLAVTWRDDAVHYLDRDLRSLGSFHPGVASPNGVVSDGSGVWIGALDRSFVTAHDTHGNFRAAWPNPGGGAGPRGLTFVGGELAVQNMQRIEFHDRGSGEMLRSIPSPATTVEGLAWDPRGVLYALEDDAIIGVAPSDGAIRRAIANPARSDPFGGTALAFIGRGRLLVGTAKGNWYIVDTSDGTVLRHGNNGLDMYGITVAADLCPEDLDGSGAVDHRDCLIILESLGRGGRADLDRSGAADFGDLLRLFAAWGECP